MTKFIIIFVNFILVVNCCPAISYSDNDFRKYGFTEDRNILIEKSIWGYRLRYARQRANSYAYVLTKLPQKKDSAPQTEKISFYFKARLYPVDPNTHDMRRVIKAYVKTSLGKTKEKKEKTGVMSAPAFVVSTRDNLNKKGHRSFPIQYSKRSDKLNARPQGVTLLYMDKRLLPLNLFRYYDVKVTFDYQNRIISFNSNGNKIILKDNYMKVWDYYGLATLFSTVGYKKNTIIALEYEFTGIKTAKNIIAINSKEKQALFPKFGCKYYKTLIKEKKDIDAMYCLGMNYYKGRADAQKDYYQAFKYFKQAAMNKHVFAQYYLGLCYLYGRGTEKDNLRAWKWLNRSSKYFYDKAQVLAAQCVIDKIKITTELDRAKLLQSLLGPAFFQGNANACFLQSYSAHYDITKTRINYLEGFKDAARRGHPKAFYYLGMYFAKKKRSMKLAFNCYLKSAKIGFVPAFNKLRTPYLI